ncbi:Gfo/Idh/MocA family protein [Aquisphaera insulae]|uniref:Gfo/Idh/MocA family protein n=1 Tax=Aquisphaera insulae TaxID=2712864 RepID=UPI0013EE3662|nr:Gfo/Idh/MocA family oxidoreductase [Aquisphaera insulae]
MIKTVVVGYGLAGKEFHSELIRRQPELNLYGVVARDPAVRAQAVREQEARGFASLDEALDDPLVTLVVLATPHNTHAEMAEKVLDAGRDCVVDKVMALTAAEADRMIAARDRSGRMLSVFHNRRWDWDFATIRRLIAEGRIGQPLLVESSVCRFSPPRSWRGRERDSGTILHDWGAHLVDHALQLGLGPCRRLSSWLIDAPWEGVDNGGHGRILMEFDGTIFQAETSRICRIDRPRWWIVGREGGIAKYGIDPQEAALRAGDIDRANEPEAHQAILRTADASGQVHESRVPSDRPHWDGYYRNIADHLLRNAPLAVTAEQAREVVKILEAAVESSRTHSIVEGPWGDVTPSTTRR